MEDVKGIPFGKYAKLFYNEKETRERLDKEIYGLEKVKERIIEMVSVNMLKKKEDRGKGFVIMLEGPAGTGKT